MAKRPALNQERIIEAAVRVADRGGLVEVSMRHVGSELGVEAMSLYHHVANKDALLDGLANWIFAHIALPDIERPWRQEMTLRAASARDVLAPHPWALGLLESRRSPGPHLLQHHDAVLGCLRHNGFSIELAAHAFSALDAYVYGFVLTETNLPFEAGESTEEYAAEMQQMVSLEEYPHLLEMLTQHVMGKDYAYGNEFTYGLDLILDSLERALLGTVTP